MFRGFSPNRCSAMKEQERRWLDNVKKAFHDSDMLFAQGRSQDSLDRFLEAQVKVVDYNGHFVARMDFASTLLRLAIFTDGHEFHDLPAQQAIDQEQNAFRSVPTA